MNIFTLGLALLQAEEEYQPLNIVYHIIHHGTIFLWVLVACSVLVVAFVIERMIFYYKRNISVIPFLENIKAFLQENRLEDAIAYCSVQNHYLPKVAAEGLKNIQRQGGNLATVRLVPIEEAMDTQKIREKQRLEQYTGFLATMGNIAPFIGLLGTVFGILYAFDTLARPDTKMGPKIIMKDISEALIATGLGLAVAIPSVIAFNFFSRKVKKCITEMDLYAMMFLTHIKSYQESEKK